jgi:hypothetical protein
LDECGKKETMGDEGVCPYAFLLEAKSLEPKIDIHSTAPDAGYT